MASILLIKGMIFSGYNFCKGNPFFRAFVFSSICSLLIFVTPEANATNRRQFLRGVLALGASPIMSGLPLSNLDGDITEVSLVIRELAEIRNFQWHFTKKPFIINPKFLEDYAHGLQKLNLHTPRGQLLRNNLIARANRQYATLRAHLKDKLKTKLEKNISTNEGQQVLHDLSSDSLIYNIVLIRGLIPPYLLSKINASLAFVSPNLFVTADEMILLRDYYLLLKMNLEVFSNSDEGYGLLENLYADTSNWFPSLRNIENNYYDSSANNIYSCEEALSL